jgi:hypothetical protein
LVVKFTTQNRKSKKENQSFLSRQFCVSLNKQQNLIRTGVNSIEASPRKTGGGFRGTRHVTSPSRQSGADTSSRSLTGTGSRHVTSFPSDSASTHHVVAAYQDTMPSLRLSVDKFLPSPIQSVPIPSTRFFFLFDYRLRHYTHFDTSPSGAFGCNGFHGESP